MLGKKHYTTGDGEKIDFHRLPDWRIDEIIVEMDEVKRKRMITEMERRLGARENMFYAEIPSEGGSGETVGVGSWRIRSWPRVEGNRESTGLIEISFVHVKPSARGRGIGKAIIEYAIDSAKAHFEGEGYSLRKAYALISSGNRSGMISYGKWGFREEAVLEKHFSTDFNTVLFSRFITQDEQ